MSFRSRMTVLAASSLLLAGCAVPGQAAAPGVAATFQDVTLTTADLDTLAQEWSDASGGQVQPSRDALATFAALGPDAVVAAEESAAEAGSDLVLNDALVRQVAENWFSGLGVTDVEVSDGVIDSMRDMLAIYLVAGADATLADITALSDGVAADATFSPRLGSYSTDALLASLDTALAAAQGGASYTAFIEVTGFGAPDVPWAARG